MKKKLFLPAVLSAIFAFEAQSLLAQTSPGGATASPSAVPNPPPGRSQQMEPMLPGKPAPSAPRETGPMPGGEPLPGQTGTIPEQIQQPNTKNQQTTGGLSSEQIRKIQEALKAKGMHPGSASGLMDPTTQQALRDFQKANNLPVTSVLDQNTAEKLGVSPGGSSPSARIPDGTNPKPNKVVP